MSPNSLTSEEIGLIGPLVDFLASAVPAHSAIYVSAPITTGRRFADWYVNGGNKLPPSGSHYEDGHRAQVLIPNRAAAAEIVSELRRRTSAIVIDPTSIPDWPGWKQDGYRHLWGRIVEQYAARVVFVEGWQFSSGCVYEFFVAVRASIRMEEPDGRELSVSCGLSLIKEAASALHDLGIVPVIHDWVLAHLKNNELIR